MENGGPKERLFSNGESFYFFEKFGEKLGLSYRYNDHWFMKEFYYFVIRPNKEVLDFMNMIKNVEWKGKVDLSKAISVHVRRGDHWMGTHPDTSKYVHAIKAVLNATKLDTVLLGSDDFDMFDLLPKQLGEQVRVVFIPNKYTILDSHKTECHGLKSRKCMAAMFLQSSHSNREKGKLNNMHEGTFILAQSLLMSETQVLIGNIGSNVDRVIHQLLWAKNSRKKHPLPTLSGFADPTQNFLDVGGTMYFACGWRKSIHRTMSTEDAVALWERRYFRVGKK